MNIRMNSSANELKVNVKGNLLNALGSVRDTIRPLTTLEINNLRLQLEEQKRNLHFKNSLSNKFDLEHEECSDDVDHANADISNFQRLRFRTRENLYERKIDEALKRIDSNEYGYCKDCGNSIGYSRLRARPTAELCIQCKEEAERDELSSNYGQQSARNFADCFQLSPQAIYNQ